MKVPETQSIRKWSPNMAPKFQSLPSLRLWFFGGGRGQQAPVHRGGGCFEILHGPLHLGSPRCLCFGGPQSLFKRSAWVCVRAHAISCDRSAHLPCFEVCQFATCLSDRGRFCRQTLFTKAVPRVLDFQIRSLLCCIWVVAEVVVEVAVVAGRCVGGVWVFSVEVLVWVLVAA